MPEDSSFSLPSKKTASIHLQMNTEIDSVRPQMIHEMISSLLLLSQRSAPSRWGPMCAD
jgi:hypothetical protein